MFSLLNLKEKFNNKVALCTSRQLARTIALATPGRMLRRAAYVIAAYTSPAPLPLKFKLDSKT